MAQDVVASVPAGKLVVRNLGLVLSGDIAAPILDADTIVAVDGRITGIGRAKDLDTDGATTTHRRAWLTGGARLDRQPCPPGGGRLDPAPESDELDRVDPARRCDHHDLGRRGPYAGPPPGHRRAESHGDLRATRLHGLPPRRHEDPRRRAGDRARHGGTGLQGSGGSRRHAARRGSGSAASRMARPHGGWWRGPANTASSRPSTRVVRRSRVPG